MDFVSGFNCLGAEETAGDKTLTVIKKVGPGLVSAISEALDKDKKVAPIVPTYTPGSGGSWLTKPALGPIPGWGVAVGGVGLLTGLGFAVKAMLKR